MAVKYPFDENVRVTLLNEAPTEFDAPTTSELNAGTDITCDLTADGLKLGTSNNSISSGGLCSSIDSQVPGRTTFSASLMGFKFKQPDATPLWDAVNKGDEAWLYVRYGMAHDAAYANGQELEAFHVLWGEAATSDTGNDTLATFTAPLHVQERERQAFVGGVS